MDLHTLHLACKRGQVNACIGFFVLMTPFCANLGPPKASLVSPLVTSLVQSLENAVMCKASALQRTESSSGKSKA